MDAALRTNRGGGRAVTVLVDADACPVKRIIVEEARRRGVPVTMLTDTSHVLREDYAAVVTVAKRPGQRGLQACNAVRGRGCGGNAGLRRGGHGSGPRRAMLESERPSLYKR